MSKIINIILLLALGIATIFIIRRMRGKVVQTKSQRIIPQDPALQASYDKQHNKNDEDKSLTIQEKIELSWQFVVNITEQVMNKFSQSDQQKLSQAGNTLRQNGMNYKHDVSQEAKITQEIVKSRTAKQNKTRER